MQFHETTIPDCLLIDLDRREDARGFFARLFCADTFRARGLQADFPQVNNSWSARKGTLRGMHYQLPPAADVKLVRVMKGAVYDVVLDLRPDSPAFKQWYAVELDDVKRQTLYVPAGCAHGFITLTDATEVLYMVSAPHTPECERGLRYNDPAFGIAWPMAPVVMSEKDQHWPDFDPVHHGIAKLKEV